ncbi:MAG: hypothetical protein RMJ53_05055 [Chitinophagales bacterium]|nr:hypothetical protein [Chitinophagales bacterium]MDW8273581.1 hypothetical protein [Chitinophagales bacterium]
MKDVIILLATVGTFSYSFAANPGNKHVFKDPDAEVALELERNKHEVILHILAQDMAQYDHIIIERSGSGGEFYSQVKYIQIEGADIEDGNYLLRVDKYPLPASVNAHYRIKTVTKDGITRTYPDVALNEN